MTVGPRRLLRGLQRRTTSNITTSSARAILAAFACLAFAPPPARAQVQLPDQFVDQLVATGLNEPTGLAFLPDQRLIVVERDGAVRMIADGKLGGVDPMVVVDSVDATGDRGMTGVAIDPRWPVKPYVYVYYDRLDGTCRITRYTAGGDLASPNSLYLYLDAASKYDVIADIPDLQSVHNGGTLRFGADSMMYAALGEDGFACAAQDTMSLRGVMIRINVRGLPDGPGGPPDKNLLVPADNPLVGYPVLNARLGWATGLRNPFRFHIDPLTHSIMVADVGWNLFEEVDAITAPMQNFGWPFYEGPAAYVSSCPGIIQNPTLKSPIFSYDRTGFTSAIISGGIYRSGPCLTCNFPIEYEGDFFFSDFYEGFLRRIKFNGTSWNLAAPVAGQPTGQDWGLGFSEVADYLVGKDGAMWYAKMGYDFMPQTGEVHRIYHDQPLGG